jgi:hypothetical protein
MAGDGVAPMSGPGTPRFHPGFVVNQTLSGFGYAFALDFVVYLIGETGFRPVEGPQRLLNALGNRS